MELVEIEEAKGRKGMRLVAVGGVPSPWSEAAKGIFFAKKIPFVCVRMNAGDPAVPEWTGETSAPVAFWDDEAPRSGWAEILLLAERVAPDPALLPEDAEERALVLGLSHEICGEMGLGWCGRIAGVHDSIESDGAVGFPKPVAVYLGDKYGYRGDNGEECRTRVIQILEMLARRLEAQKERDSRYYFGDRLGALDIYSATFMALLYPLPPEQCPMPEMFRAAFKTSNAATLKALSPILLEHRDYIYEQHLELPLTL